MAIHHGAYSNSLNEILVRLLLIGFIILLLLHSCSYVYSFICCCLCVCELFRLQSRYDFQMLLFSCVHTGQPFRGRNCQSHSVTCCVHNVQPSRKGTVNHTPDDSWNFAAEDRSLAEDFCPPNPLKTLLFYCHRLPLEAK